MNFSTKYRSNEEKRIDSMMNKFQDVCYFFHIYIQNAVCVFVIYLLGAVFSCKIVLQSTVRMKIKFEGKTDRNASFCSQLQKIAFLLEFDIYSLFIYLYINFDCCYSIWFFFYLFWLYSDGQVNDRVDIYIWTLTVVRITESVEFFFFPFSAIRYTFCVRACLCISIYLSFYRSI